MDNLPSHLLLEILTKLRDTTELTRCKLVSKTFNSVTRDLNNIVNLQCSFSRYLDSRSSSTKPHKTPFKTLVRNVVRTNPNIDSVAIGVDDLLNEVRYAGEDLYLTDAAFVKEWLLPVSAGLKSISISDFWFHSRWKKSEVLLLISSCCHKLVELELKNTWLSVSGLSVMGTLQSLTLESVTLDDKDLETINHGFPSLQVLNLIRVSGLTHPKIQLLHLKTCHWVCSAQYSLAITAPSLTKLVLICSSPSRFVIKAPLLSDFNLSIERVRESASVDALPNLETLQLVSPNLCRVIKSMPCETVKYLTVDLLKRDVKNTRLDPRRLFKACPNLCTLKVESGAWFAAENWHETKDLSSLSYIKHEIQTMKLERIVGRMIVYDVEIAYALISYFVYGCASLSKVSLLIHRSIDPSISCDLVVKCMVNYPKVQWKWGTWKEEESDDWSLVPCDLKTEVLKQRRSSEMYRRIS